MLEYGTIPPLLRIGLTYLSQSDAVTFRDYTVTPIKIVVDFVRINLITLTMFVQEEDSRTY